MNGIVVFTSIILLYLDIYMCATSQCFKPDKTLQSTAIGRKLDHFPFIKVVSLGPLDCARYCLRYALCQSVNYESVSRQCELMSTAVGNFVSNSTYSFIDVHFWSEELLGSCNNHNCNNNTFCREDDGDLLNQYVCVPFGCLGAPPPVNNINITSFTYKPVWYINETVLYACTAGYFPSQNVYCHELGHWSAFFCKPITECQQLQMCGQEMPNHYLLFIDVFSAWVKVFCDLDGSNFITLPRVNVGIFSLGRRTSPSCASFLEDNPEDFGMGFTTFTKYRLWRTENYGALKTNGFRYSSILHQRQKVGHAGDCYTGDNVTECGTKGYFIIDLRDTVFRVNTTEEWVGFGNNSVINISRSYDNQVIEGHCGGNCGGCRPESSSGSDYIYLEIIPGYLPPMEEAIPCRNITI